MHKYDQIPHGLMVVDAAERQRQADAEARLKADLERIKDMMPLVAELSREESIALFRRVHGAQ